MYLLYEIGCLASNAMGIFLNNIILLFSNEWLNNFEIYHNNSRTIKPKVLPYRTRLLKGFIRQFYVLPRTAFDTTIIGFVTLINTYKFRYNNASILMIISNNRSQYPSSVNEKFHVYKNLRILKAM